MEGQPPLPWEGAGQGRRMGRRAGAAAMGGRHEGGRAVGGRQGEEEKNTREREGEGRMKKKYVGS